MPVEKKTVLIVDDEDDIRLILNALLDSEGYNVLEADNGIAGLEVAQNNAVDIILLDVMMPGMDGFETLENLRADEKTAFIPVVMLTGLDEKEKIKNALGQGVTYYITKPYENIDLMNKIRAALSEQMI